MDILDQVRADIARGPIVERIRVVCGGAGIKFSTLRNLIYGQTKFPRYDTVLKLRRYYELTSPARVATEPTAAQAPADLKAGSSPATTPAGESL